ncbi:MAG: HAMP domain-containing histidine kinase [Elusimicrobia bacterium]|nr:HAMP domain-containing histidine kinase [Elusimicrobiota bacterium]
MNASGQANRYEAVFCIFMAALAYLGRDDSLMVYPQILYLFGGLLALNFLAGRSLRRWPAKEWLSACVILGNCAVIAGIEAFSGGAGSTLWVLYLLPVFTAAMLLDGRKLAIITAGAVGADAAFYVGPGFGSDGAAVFGVAVKSGVLVFAAAVVWLLARREKEAHRELGRRRADIDAMARQARAREGRLREIEGLAEVGLVGGGIVHDLRTPLSVIRGYLNICLKSAELPASLRDHVERMDRSALLCQDIVAGILDAIRNRPLKMLRCDMRDIVAASVEQCRGIMDEAGVGLDLAVQPFGLPVQGSPEHLKRVLINLIGNAVKAMAGAGRLRIATETEAGDRPVLRVSVEDTGSGMSEEALSRLFKPFGTTRAEAGGVGLGLYVCREIALKHDGWLTGQNLPAGGARFTLALPLAGPEPCVKPAPAPARRLRVLVADDDYLRRRDLSAC